MVNWLHWTGERFPSFDLDILRICKSVEADDKGHLVTIAANDDAKWLSSTEVKFLEDLALQATMFA